MKPFQLTTSSAGDGRAVIAVSGELDLATAPLLEEALEEASGAPGTVLDLEQVTFLDSSGLRVVLLATRRAREAGRRLVVRPGEGNVLRTLEVARVAEHLDLADDAG